MARRPREGLKPTGADDDTPALAVQPSIGAIQQLSDAKGCARSRPTIGFVDFDAVKRKANGRARKSRRD